MTLLLALLACNPDKDDPTVTISDDTGVECGRVRGTSYAVMIADGTTLVAPVAAPDATSRAMSVAGPLSDGFTWVLAVDGQTFASTDGGCNWESVGGLPAANDWSFTLAGDRVYAFDRGSGAGARSDDAGSSWTPFDAGEAFIGKPTADAADPERLRGLQSRGVVTSTDGGTTWTAVGVFPEGATDAWVHPANLDVLAAATPAGIFYTRGGGVSWDDVSATLPQDATTPGVSGLRVAIHPDDDNRLFALSEDSTGLITLSMSADHGATWTRIVDSTGITLDASTLLRPTPGNVDQVIGAYATSAESLGTNLYTATAGAGARTLHFGTWFNVRELVVTPDRWMLAADGIP